MARFRISIVAVLVAGCTWISDAKLDERASRDDGGDPPDSGSVEGTLPCTEVPWYADADGDGFGDSSRVQEACDPPDGYVENGSDCDDASASVNPEAHETCDGADEDCDGNVDEGAVSSWFRDRDGDGFGAGYAMPGCEAPDGYVGNDDDCDDDAATVHPGGTEECDGLDDDCDGLVDLPVPGDAPVWHEDGDGDGFGRMDSGVMSCDQPDGYVEDHTDCDDTDASRFPADVESACNDGETGSVDNDCDGYNDHQDADCD
jgi:hypothetical protein